MAATDTSPPVKPLVVTLPAHRRWRNSARALGLLACIIATAAIALLSLRYGSLELKTSDAWNAIFHYDKTSYEQTVVRSLRVPRTVIALGVGCALAVAGTIMQAVTRNPLADPSILGVSAGASFGVVTAVFFLGLTAPYQFVWFAFGGALIASFLVFAIGSAGSGGATPVKLALAGVVISSLLAAWTSALLLLDENTMDIVRFWSAGSVAGRPLSVFWWVAPFLLGGAFLGIFLGHQLNVMSMGEETARSLGMNTGRTRIVASFLVVLITGAAVAVAGPIGFIGLTVPHIVRSVIGPDYRWVLPYSLVVGAAFLTASDILGRVVARPGEIQVGIVTAILGAPFLILLARQRTVAN